MADIGLGDVVEAIYDFAYFGVSMGERHAVSEIVPNSGQCSECGGRDNDAFLLEAAPLFGAWVSWCPCGWRKIGGSKSDTIRQFENDLNTDHPSVRRWRVEA